MKSETKILVIDDDHDFVALTKIVLESKPYEVIVAYDGDEGFNKAQEEMPDLIILDVIMPLKDGFAVCEQLKKDPRLCSIPVLMLTSFGERVGETTLAMGQGLTLEADDFIDKPVTPAELLIRVERLLR